MAEAIEVSRWLAAFEHSVGRPLRVLHIGNIANNAYTNASIQRKYGIEADVICYDYYHVMACPEWADYKFDGVVDPDLPDWWATSLGGWRRPRWFAQGSLALCVKYLAAYRGGNTQRARRLWRRLEHSYRARLDKKDWRSVFRKSWVLGMRRFGERGLDAVRARLSLRRYDVPFSWQGSLRGTLAVIIVRSVLSLDRRVTPRFRLVHRKVFPFDGRRDQFERFYAQELPAVDPATRRADVAYVEAIAGGWQDLLRQYDIVQAYAIDGYIPLYNRVRSYCAYEHGTLRELPFEPTQVGRLCRLAYRHAGAVFVTNVDVLPSVERLEIAPSRIVCLPHACDDKDILCVAAANPMSRPRADGVVTFLAPARHHWSYGGVSWEKGNDRIIRAGAMLHAEGARFEIILVDWGLEVEKSRALIAELDCAAVFRWVRPMHKRELWKAFLEAHCVLNQFRVPAIGGVDFEALTLGRRLVTYVDPVVMAGFFGAAPPILAASSPEEIAAQMRRVVADPQDHAQIGERGQEWARRYHSTERVMALQVEAYKRLLSMDPASVETERHAAGVADPAA